MRSLGTGSVEPQVVDQDDQLLGMPGDRQPATFAGAHTLGARSHGFIVYPFLTVVSVYIHVYMIIVYYT